MVALSCYPLKPRYIGTPSGQRPLESGHTHRRGSDERTNAITNFVICDTDVAGRETPSTGSRRRLLAGGFMLHQLFNFALLLVACLAVFLALRIGRPDGGDEQGSPEIVEQMGALVFRCPKY